MRKFLHFLGLALRCDFDAQVARADRFELRALLLGREIRELVEEDCAGGSGLVSSAFEIGAVVSGERPPSASVAGFIMRIDLHPMSRYMSMLSTGSRWCRGAVVSTEYARWLGEQVAREFGDYYARGIIESIISAARQQEESENHGEN